LLGRAADAGVADDADRETGGETRETDGQAGCQVHETPAKEKGAGLKS
jgi:hypothetical protein